MSELERLEDLRTVANAGIGWMERALTAEEELAGLKQLRPASEWKESDGAVLWWRKDGALPTTGARRSNAMIRLYRGWSRIPAVELPKEGK